MDDIMKGFSHYYLSFTVPSDNFTILNFTTVQIRDTSFESTFARTCFDVKTSAYRNVLYYKSRWVLRKSILWIGSYKLVTLTNKSLI